MKTTTLFLMPLLALLGCTGENPVRGLVTPDDSPDSGALSSPDAGDRQLQPDGAADEPDMPRGRPGDVTQPLDLGAPDADEADLVALVEIDASEADAAITEPDAGSEDALLPDAEADANPRGCFAQGAGCPQDQLCDSHVSPPQCVPDTICDLPDSPRCSEGLTCDRNITRLCVLLCDGLLICPEDTPFCIPAHPPLWATNCGQCLDDFSCPEDQHCNRDIFMCERDDGR